MPVTLAQLAKVETQPLRKYVLENMIRTARVMEILPFENVDSLRSIAVRWQTLPAVAFRAIGGTYTASEGDVEQVWESVYILGGRIQWDRVFEKVKNTIVDPKKLQTDMKLKSLALTINDYFINGQLAVDPLGFEGLKTRIAAMPSRQTIYAVASGSAALDPTASVANGRRFFDCLEEAHYKTNSGDCSGLFLNEGLYYGLGKVARYIAAAGGLWLDVTKDSFERQIVTYKGAPLIDVGLKKDQSTEIITATENDGTGAIGTSVYMASFNMEQGVTGIQLGPLETYDPWNGGEDANSPQHELRVEWVLGLAGFGSYGATRIRNVESAGNWT